MTLASLPPPACCNGSTGALCPRPKDTGKDFFTRVGETNAAKRHLAQLAANRVEDGQIVLFDSGSTTLQIAQSLPHSATPDRGHRFADDRHRPG